MKKYIILFSLILGYYVNAQDSLRVHLQNGDIVQLSKISVDSIKFKENADPQSDSIFIKSESSILYAETITKLDSITFNNPKPILAEWDFPVSNGEVTLSQTGGSLSFGSFTGFNSKLTADAESGVVATGTLWDVKDPGIGIILQFTSPQDFSQVSTVTFTVKVENPPVTSPGIMAYVQNGQTLNWAGDYSFWRPAPITDFYTFTYPIDKTASGLDITKIYSFRIKANGNGISGTGCGTGGTCAIVHVKKVVMQ